MSISDVRSHIPFTDQTNPGKFPGYEHREYPKMMLQPDGKPYRNDATKQPVVVADKDEEHEFRSEHPDAQVVTNNAQLNAAERAELEQLRQKRDNGGTDKQPNSLAGLTKRDSPTAPVKKAAANKKGQQLKDKDGRPLPKPLS